MKIQLQNYIWYWNIRNAQRPITAFATGTMKLVKIRWVRPPCHPRKDLNQLTNIISDRTTSKCKSVQTRINICTKFKERKSIGEGWIWPPGKVFFISKQPLIQLTCNFAVWTKFPPATFKAIPTMFNPHWGYSHPPIRGSLSKNRRFCVFFSIFNANFSGKSPKLW